MSLFSKNGECDGALFCSRIISYVLLTHC